MIDDVLPYNSVGGCGYSSVLFICQNRDLGFLLSDADTHKWSVSIDSLFKAQVPRAMIRTHAKATPDLGRAMFTTQ